MEIFEFVILFFALLIFCIFVPFYILTKLLAYIISVIGKVEVYQGEAEKKKWKEFGMKFSIFLTSSGLAFFLVAHIYFVPIADRMIIHNEEVKEKVGKGGKRFTGRNNVKFSRSTGFPRRKVFVT